MGPALNNQNHEAAEDRVQDAFVQFMPKLALTNIEPVRSAFTISARSSAGALRSSFWRSWANAQALAQGIERYGR